MMSSMLEELKMAAKAVGLEPMEPNPVRLKKKSIYARFQGEEEVWWAPLEFASDAEMILCALRPAVVWGGSWLRVEGSAGVVSFSDVPDTPNGWTRAYREALIKYAVLQYHKENK
jgi:hypothetical protein